MSSHKRCSESMQGGELHHEESHRQPRAKLEEGDPLITVRLDGEETHTASPKAKPPSLSPVNTASAFLPETCLLDVLKRIVSTVQFWGLSCTGVVRPALSATATGQARILVFLNYILLGGVY